MLVSENQLYLKVDKKISHTFATTNFLCRLYTEQQSKKPSNCLICYLLSSVSKTIEKHKWPYIASIVKGCL